MRATFGLFFALSLGCGGTATLEPQPGGGPSPGIDPPILVPPRGLPPHAPLPRIGALPCWQPGFHQALRWDEEVGSPTTYRMRIPVARAGAALRFAFRAGDGNAELLEATVARAGVGGRLASDPVPITFGGAPGFRAGERERVLSDPIDFPVEFREELYVSFEVKGHLAAGAIDLFPDSWASTTARPRDRIVDERRALRPVALASVLVYGDPGPAFVALGDSITEAFVDGRDDYRRNWPQIAEAIVGVPIANAAVSGQGLWGAREYLEGEVLVLPGISDCLVLLGTNDLGAVDAEELQDSLARLYADLTPFCTIWAATLPPKERPDITEEILRVRRKVNEWIRNEAPVAGVIDFARVLADPDDPDRWREGLGEDGVHPSVEGQRAMGEEAARFLTEEVLGRR